MNKIAALGKILKLKELWKKASEPLKIHEDIMPQEDGTAVYECQMLFKDEEAAEIFKQLQQLSAELESEMLK